MQNAAQRLWDLLRRNSGTLLAAAVAALTAAVLFAGSVSVSLGDDALRIDATFSAPVSIGYDDIRAARLLEEMDVGRRLNGMRGARLLAGQYQNGQFGGYTLYALADAPAYVDLVTDAGHVVFSAADEAATREIYERLLDRLPVIP